MTLQCYEPDWNRETMCKDDAGLWVTFTDAQAAIAEAEARGYARGVEDAARWHDRQANDWALVSNGAASVGRHRAHATAIRALAKRAANGMPSAGHLINAAEDAIAFGLSLRASLMEDPKWRTPAPEERTANDAPATGHASNAAE